MRSFKFSNFNLDNRSALAPKGLSKRERMDYLSKADLETFIYDILFDDDMSSALLISPRMTSEGAKFLQNLIDECDNADMNFLVDTTQNCVIEIKALKGELDNKVLKLFNLNKNDLPSIIYFLKEVCPKKISFTIQKDESLAHIDAWIAHQFDDLGADCVVVFDNNSTSYTVDQLSTHCKQFSKPVFVQSIPFLYGPAGKGVDGHEYRWKDLCLQRSMLEYVKFSSLIASPDVEVLLLNTDVDEFLISRSSPFDEVNDSVDFVAFRGFWCYPNSDSSDLVRNQLAKLFFHEDHTLIASPFEFNTTSKWIFRIKGVNSCLPLGVHGVEDSENLKAVGYTSSNSYLLHHRYVNTGWKTNARIDPSFMPKQMITFERNFLSLRKLEIQRWYDLENELAAAMAQVTAQASKITDLNARLDNIEKERDKGINSASIKQEHQHKAIDIARIKSELTSLQLLQAKEDLECSHRVISDQSNMLSVYSKLQERMLRIVRALMP